MSLCSNHVGAPPVLVFPAGARTRVMLRPPSAQLKTGRGSQIAAAAMVSACAAQASRPNRARHSRGLRKHVILSARRMGSELGASQDQQASTATPRSAFLRAPLSIAAGFYASSWSDTERDEVAHAEAGLAGPFLAGRTAVVTGASRGIGKGIAVGLGEAGARVFVTARDTTKASAVAELVTRAGGKGVPLVCDHSDDKQVEAAFQEVGRQTDGKLDILVNNAFKDPSATPGVDDKFTRGAKFYELPLSVWDDMHNVGLRSHYVASYFAAPLLLAAAKEASQTRWRPLVCTTSSFGAVSYLFTAAYGVGKAGSDRLMRDLQVEFGPDGIDCVSVWPGLVLTEKVQSLMRTDRSRIDRITGGQDIARVGESPLLTGRVVAQIAAQPNMRKEPLVTSQGITGRVCIVAEAAADLGLRDGGQVGSVAAELYGLERKPAPSIRSLGFLGPGPLRNSLPASLQWLAEPGAPLANENIKLPLEFMAQGPPPKPA